MCQADQPITDDIRKKISLFCNIPPENAIPNLTAPILYEVPLMLEEEGLAQVVCKRLNLNVPPPDLTGWTRMVEPGQEHRGRPGGGGPGRQVRGLHDSYLSVVEALTHGGIENDVKVKIRWIDSNWWMTAMWPKCWRASTALSSPAASVPGASMA